MQDTWIAIGVVLIAVLTGFLVPVLLQLMMALRSLRRTVDRLAPRIDRTLVEVQKATERVNQLGATLNRGSEQVLGLIQETDELVVAVRKLRRALRVATAVGPAVAAAIEAFSRYRHAPEEEQATEAGGEGAAPAPDGVPAGEQGEGETQ